MRLTFEQRSLIADAVRRDIKINRIAEVIGVTLKTIRKWAKRKCFADKKRRAKRRKITVAVEYSILALRNSFNWGSARIKQGLYALPQYVLDTVPNLVQGICLSRQAINDVLMKHQLNGYQTEKKGWKFFRAQKSNELWQLDLKGPFTLQGKRYWFVVCIDDYSRYLLLHKELDHCPTTKEVFALLEPLIQKYHLEKILTDNGSQFKEQWKRLCKKHAIEPLFAHPYYPQDKGKVERAIRNVSEEFIYLLKKWPEWLDHIEEYNDWFNTKRYHRGIHGYPAEVYLET